MTVQLKYTQHYTTKESLEVLESIPDILWKLDLFSMHFYSCFGMRILLPF